MYDDYLKLESFKKDWSIRHNQESGDTTSINEESDGLDDSTNWNAQNNKEIFLRPKINVVPMTI